MVECVLTVAPLLALSFCGSGNGKGAGTGAAAASDAARMMNEVKYLIVTDKTGILNEKSKKK